MFTPDFLGQHSPYIHYSIEGLLGGVDRLSGIHARSSNLSSRSRAFTLEPHGKRLPFQRESRMKIENSWLAPAGHAVEIAGEVVRGSTPLLMGSLVRPKGRFAESTCRISV